MKCLRAMGLTTGWVLVAMMTVGFTAPPTTEEQPAGEVDTSTVGVVEGPEDETSEPSTPQESAPGSEPTPHVPAAEQAQSVYRFWSDSYQSHFYTRSVAERDHVRATYPDNVWRYEGAVFGAFGTQVPDSVPVYRFWSNAYSAHFYTASESEKNHVIATYPVDVWRYEQVAYYAYAASFSGAETRLMARFWSPTYLNHFYTASPTEAETVKTSYPKNIWTFEGNLFRVPAQYAPAAPLPELDLATSLTKTLSSLGGRYSVTVIPLEGGGEPVSIRGGTMQEPVSVIKLFVAYAVLDRIDRELLSFGTATRSGVSVQDCLRVMIHVSDNYCHWDLVDLVGKQNLNNQFWAEGYLRTVYDGYRGDGIYYSAKRSTTDDLALLLTRLHRGELLSPELTDHFKTLLETQLWRSKLPASVPTGAPVANKTGSAWTANGWYHSDAGIISAPGGDYVVAVLGSQGASASGVRAIGRTVYEYLYGPVGTAAAYSDLNSVTTSATTYYRYGSTSTPLGTIPAGTRIETYASARTWYQVRYNGSLVYVHSSNLRNYYDYPRS